MNVLYGERKSLRNSSQNPQSTPLVKHCGDDTSCYKQYYSRKLQKTITINKSLTQNLPSQSTKTEFITRSKYLCSLNNVLSTLNDRLVNVVMIYRYVYANKKHSNSNLFLKLKEKMFEYTGDNEQQHVSVSSYTFINLFFPEELDLVNIKHFINPHSSTDFSHKVLCNSMYGVDGEHASNLKSEFVRKVLGRKDNHKFPILCDEPDYNEKIDVATMKTLSGSDSLFSRNLFEQGKEITPLEYQNKLHSKQEPQFSVNIDKHKNHYNLDLVFKDENNSVCIYIEDPSHISKVNIYNDEGYFDTNPSNGEFSFSWTSTKFSFSCGKYGSGVAGSASGTFDVGKKGIKSLRNCLMEWKQVEFMYSSFD
jgi:hypothetical protein